MKHRKIIIANWKLHQNRSSAKAFFEEVLPLVKDLTFIDMAVAPVTPMLDFVGSLIKGKNIALCAQNVFYEEKGAFTGEWSAEQLLELGVTYCIVGHSERRRIFKETDEDIAKKAKACLMVGIVPVICIGETELEYEAGKTKEVLRRQMAKVMDLVKSIKKPFIFAYEPVWAIGTGKTPHLTQIQELHKGIRDFIFEMTNENAAEMVRILYGGSVNAENTREITSLPDVDGVLVGGASLQAASFLSMVKMFPLMI